MFQYFVGNSFADIKNDPLAVIKEYNNIHNSINSLLTGAIRDKAINLLQAKFTDYFKYSIESHCENMFSAAAKGKTSFSKILANYNNLLVALEEVNLGDIKKDLKIFTENVYKEATEILFNNRLAIESGPKNDLSLAITFLIQEYGQAINEIKGSIKNESSRQPFIDALDGVFDKYANWATESFVSFLDEGNAKRSIYMEHEFNRIIYHTKNKSFFGDILAVMKDAHKMKITLDEAGETKAEAQSMNYMNHSTKEQISEDIRAMFNNARDSYLKSGSADNITHEEITGSSRIFTFTDLLVIQNDLKYHIDNFVKFGDKTNQHEVDKLTTMINNTFVSRAAKEFLNNMLQEISDTYRKDQAVLDELYDICAQNNITIPIDETIDDKFTKHSDMLNKTFAGMYGLLLPEHYRSKQQAMVLTSSLVIHPAFHEVGAVFLDREI
jgi:hypothetical protein